MEKKSVLFGSIIVFLVGGIALMMWRSHIMGPDARTSAGGLVAVSPDGTPISFPAAQIGADPPPENPAVQESGGKIVSLKLDPYPPSVAKATEFEVTLKDGNGQAISDATISLDLTMPGMYMPPNQVNLASGGQGEYKASGRFTMRGPWRIEAIITVAGKTQSVFFDVWL